MASLPSPSAFLSVKNSIPLNRTPNGVTDLITRGFMQPMNSLNGYCFSIDIEKWSDEKSLLSRWSQVAGRGDHPGRLRSTAGHGGWTVLAADTGAHGTLSRGPVIGNVLAGPAGLGGFLSVETCIINMQ